MIFNDLHRFWGGSFQNVVSPSRILQGRRLSYWLLKQVYGIRRINLQKCEDLYSPWIEEVRADFAEAGY